MREGGCKRGGMNCYRSRGKAKQRYVARGIYMEIPYAFGKTCFSSRLVLSRLVSRDAASWLRIYKHRPLKPITRDLVGFVSQEITPPLVPMRRSSFPSFFFSTLFALNICPVAIDQFS